MLKIPAGISTAGAFLGAGRYANQALSGDLYTTMRNRKPYIWPGAAYRVAKALRSVSANRPHPSAKRGSR